MPTWPTAGRNSYLPRLVSTQSGLGRATATSPAPDAKTVVPPPQGRCHEHDASVKPALSVLPNNLGSMTVVSVAVPPVQRSLLHHVRGRPIIFDSSVLTSDVIAGTRRSESSSFVAGMRKGTLRGFISHGVWAEVPRVLEDRSREGEDFDLAAAQNLWWSVYVPLLYTVCTDLLPLTPIADQLLLDNPSDVGLLQLHGALGPAVLIAADRDLIRTGIAYPDWPRLRAAVGQVGLAEAKVDTADHLTSLTLQGTVRAVVGAGRAARCRPRTTLLLCVALVAAALLYRSSHEWPSIARVKLRLEHGARGIKELVDTTSKQYQLGDTVWTAAERETVGDTMLHRVSQLLARKSEPMTRTEILAAVEEFPGRTHRDRMNGLHTLLAT